MGRLILKAIFLMIVLSGISFLEGNPALGAGADIYKANCVICHGEKGDGNGPMARGLKTKPADFTDKEHMAKESAEHFFEIVKKGKGEMLPFGGVLKDEEIREVIRYIRQFSR